MNMTTVDVHMGLDPVPPSVLHKAKRLSHPNREKELFSPQNSEGGTHFFRWRGNTD